MSYALDVNKPGSTCNINDIDTTTRQGKTTNFKTTTHSFHTANISYRHISSQPQFFIIIGKQEPDVNK